MNLTPLENLLREARAELQRRTGENYCELGIEGCGKVRVYVNGAGSHSGTTLAEAFETAVRASAPLERAERLRAEAKKKLEEAEKLESKL